MNNIHDFLEALMKKVLLIVALILFAGGLYVNFAMSPSTEQASLTNETDTSDETADNPDTEATNDAEDDTAENENEDNEEETAESDDESSELSDDENQISFNQESLDELYNQAVENNETLIIDVLLPSYYTEDFMTNMEAQFDADAIQFNRLDLTNNTTTLNELSVNDNSDAVIIDALQIMDYNDEVLPERDEDALTTAYMNLYNSDKVVMLLGNANVHEHENLANVLDEDASYFTDNDYYYIDNQDVSVEDEYYDYDNDVMAGEVENEVISNIHSYLIDE